MSDTPTHRVHILQARMQEVIEWTKLLQAQRAQIVEKLVRVKTNSKIARAIQVEAALERLLKRIDRDLISTEERLNRIVDSINQCRGLFLELSDFEVVLEHTEKVHGNNATSTRDRGAVSQGADRYADNASALHDGGATESTAPADHGDGPTV